MNDSSLLKSKMLRQPFRAFVIEFANGQQIFVDDDTEMLFPRKRPELVIAFTGDGLMHEFEIDAVARLVEPT